MLKKVSGNAAIKKMHAYEEPCKVWGSTEIVVTHLLFTVKGC
jgi:hypothetical protein